MLYPNQTVNLSESINVWDGIGLATPLNNNSQYYFVTFINFDSKLDETTENDNIFSFPFNYSTNSSNKIGKTKQPLSVYKESNSSINNFIPYDLYIYKFNGKLVDKVLIKSLNDEKEVLKNLPKSIYILNSVNGSRKVLIKQ